MTNVSIVIGRINTDAEDRNNWKIILNVFELIIFYTFIHNYEALTELFRDNRLCFHR